MKNQGGEEIQNNQVDSFMELEKQQVITMLKQKIKQNKTLLNKISKHEIKYVDIFQENKRLKKESENFISFIKIIFTDFQQKTESYTLQSLEELWKKRQECFSQKLRNLIEQTTKEKNQIRVQLENQFNKKMKQFGKTTKTSTQTLQSEIQILKKNNKILMDQINQFDKKIDQQNQQITKLRKQRIKIQHQLNQMRKKEIESQLHCSNEEDKNNQQNSNRRNQFLALRQQVENLISARDEARREIKNLKSQLKIKNQIAQLKDKEINQFKQQINKYNKLQQKNGHSEEEDSKKNINHNNQHNKENLSIAPKEEQEMIHRQYLKNILVRYFKSCNDGDQVRSELLLNIIVTILKFNTNQLKFVQYKKKSWWSLY